MTITIYAFPDDRPASWKRRRRFGMTQFHPKRLPIFGKARALSSLVKLMSDLMSIHHTMNAALKSRQVMPIGGAA